MPSSSLVEVEVEVEVEVQVQVKVEVEVIKLYYMLLLKIYASTGGWEEKRI